MKNIWIMSVFTLREALAKKVFIFFTGFSLLVLLILGLVFGLTAPEMLIPNTGDTSQFTEQVITQIQVAISGSLGSLLLFLAIFSSATFISSMLEKGTADLFLSKPVSRGQLIWGKYLGGCISFLINILLPVIGSWLIVSLKFDFYSFTFFWIILSYTFVFAVLYSLIVFMGVLTRSSAPGIMTTYFVFIVLSPLLALGNENAAEISSSPWVQGLIKGFYYIIPKTSEIMGNMTNNLILQKSIEDFQPVITSFLFLIFMMFLSIYLFRKKDF
jgi:ABC-type transport system involved in multi-copper enzyme maturation permease subunit